MNVNTVMTYIHKLMFLRVNIYYPVTFSNCSYYIIVQTFRKYLFFTCSGQSETSADGLMGKVGGGDSAPNGSI